MSLVRFINDPVMRFAAAPCSISNLASVAQEYCG